MCLILFIHVVVHPRPYRPPYLMLFPDPSVHGTERLLRALTVLKQHSLASAERGGSLGFFVL